MKKVLMIAYHFPPIDGGGVFRTLKFVKFLPNFNWKPYIISVKNPMYKLSDPSLLEEIPYRSVVKRVFSFESRFFMYPFNKLKINPLWFFLPDIYMGFIPFGFLWSLRLIKKYNIDLIYATGPPFTSLVIGYLLKKFTKKPLVVDFRDPWTQGYLKQPSSIYKKLFWLESIIIGSADSVIASTKEIVQNLQRMHIGNVPKKFIAITNGYDPEDFIEIDRKTDVSKLHIAHAGSFYRRIQPTNLFKAVIQLIDSKQIAKEEITITLIGSEGELFTNENKLKDIVKKVGWIPHKKALELLAGSHVLFITRPSIGFKESIPAKIFEYLALKKAILALIPDGAASNLIKELNAGIVVHPDDLNSIKRIILKLFRDWKRKRLAEINIPNLEKFERKMLTKKLVSVFEKVYQII